MFTMVNYASFNLSRGQHPLCESFNEGDDALAVYHNGLGPDENWWKNHGWEVKVEFKGPVNEASFCGLVFDPDDLVSVPDIRKTLAKFGWTNRRYVKSSWACHMSLLRSKALSLACEYNNVPVLGEFAQRVLYLTKHVNIRKSVINSMPMYEREKMLSYLKEKPWLNKPKVGWNTRLLVQKLQNITIAQQQECERILREVVLGCSFSLLCLDFNPIWVNNMSRCRETFEIPREFQHGGRKVLVQEMRTILLRDIDVSTSGNRSRLRKMLHQLVLLEFHRI